MSDPARSKHCCKPLFGGAVAGVLSECHGQAVTVADHKLARSIDSIFGTVENLRTAQKKLLRQPVDPGDAKVRVIGTVGPAPQNMPRSARLNRDTNLIMVET